MKPVLFSVCHRCQKRFLIFNVPVLLFLQGCFNFKNIGKTKYAYYKTTN